MTSTENWDDDFEFNPNSPPRKNTSKTTTKSTTATATGGDAGQTRMSSTSSRFTLDWDTEMAGNSLANTSPGTHRSKVFTAPKLSDWAELAGPSTPTAKRSPTAAAAAVVTEDWDDDFEDKNETPVRTRTTRGGDQSSPTKEITRNYRSLQPLSGNENVDHKMLTPGRNRASSSASTQYSRSKISSGDLVVNSFPGSDGDEEDDDFGFMDKDEDRTVTGRSRRPGLPRLNSLTNHPLNTSPPPPVPSLPAHLASSGAHHDRDHPQPFPRSPSSSVFSLPTTIAGESMYYGSTAHLHPTASRTSSSGGGGGGHGFSHLPPSPPIHKERERRRLRKKSRPQPQGVFEMLPVESGFSSSGGLPALQEVERPHSPARDSIHSNTQSRPRTPQTPNSSTHSSPFVSPVANVNTTPLSSRHSGSVNSPPTPSGAKGALLSRIGSVKKWGVRRSRGVSITQKNTAATNGQDLTVDDPRTAARPTSSLSSLPLSRTSSHHSSRPVSPSVLNPNPNGGSRNWFFRNSDTFTTPPGGISASLEYSSAEARRRHGPGAGGVNNASATDLSSRGRSHDRSAGASVEVDRGKSQSRKPSSSRNRVRNRTPSRCRDAQARAPGLVPSHTRLMESGKEKDVMDTPSKLLKRKSLGFVQLRRTLSGLGNGNGDTQDGMDGLKAENAGNGVVAAGQPRHVSYGDMPHKSIRSKGDVFQDWENTDLTSIPPPSLDIRGRKKSLSVTGGKMWQDLSDVEKPQDAGKSFIRSVRKMSIVGRHKRERSGTVVARFEERREPNGMSTGSQSELARPPASDAYTPPPQGLLSPAEIRDKLPVAKEAPPKEFAELEAVPTIDDTKPALPQTPRRKVSNLTTPPTSPKRTPPAKSPTRGQTSPQSASLGRSTYSPTRNNESPDEKAAPRRNSLGDLKIPARISQAQVGLRRDLGMVREFAHNVEQLRDLQCTYHGLVVEIQALLDSHAYLHAQQATRSVSPSFFSRPVRRKRSNTNPDPAPAPAPAQHMAYKELVSAFYTINSKYRITWECAELLIELGGGSSAGPPRPTTSVSAPTMQTGGDGGSLAQRKGRERAITLAGNESKPPSPMPGMKSLAESSSGAAAFANPSVAAGWHAPTSRQELSQRQMILLKELLNNADSSFIADDVKAPIQEDSRPVMVNKEWKWGDPSNSTITLPPSESSGAASAVPSSKPNKKGRGSRLGMAGLRDLLKMLKRHHTAHPAHPMPSFGSIPQSTSSIASAANSSSDAHYGYPSTGDLNRSEGGRLATFGRRRAKTSLGPESISSSSRGLSPLTIPSMYDSTPLPSRQSRGRPSLAAIFRIPNSLKPHKVSGSHSIQSDVVNNKKGRNVISGSNSPAEEDWDRIDMAADLDKAANLMPGVCGDGPGIATVRGKGQSPYLQQPPASLYNGGRISPRPRSSQTSLFEDSPSSSSHNVRPVRLSNVDEDGGEGCPLPGCLLSTSHDRPVQRPLSRPPPSPSSSASANVNVTPPPRTSSRYYNGNKTPKNGSVRSMPPQPMAELRLAMTPENIKPLVENAKEVYTRLLECIAEIQTLLENHRSQIAPEPGK
ncbi:hypothetical protein AX15_004168 [Amanita polypyramis BW_CC]|nr:hypothetical protein AX15_004168 [Amanita polypyramis BW_CC]